MKIKILVVRNAVLCLVNLYAQVTKKCPILTKINRFSVSNCLDWFNSNRLVVNASKTSTMLITTPYNITNICKPFINDATLEHNTSSKLLGIMIDQTLKWDTHVLKVRLQKINPKIGLIHRLKKMLPTKVLSTLYLILIQPHIDYCISVWGACALKYINLIQRLQNRAARAVTGIFDYNQSVSAIINSLNWVTVKSRYFYFLGIFVYKCLNHIAPSSLVERFNVMDDSRPYHTRAVSNKDLIIPHSHLSICKTSVSL